VSSVFSTDSTFYLVMTPTIETKLRLVILCMYHAEVKMESHFTAFRRRLPGLNFATFDAGILISPPVLGFLPVLAFLFATEKVPNPGRVSLSPFFRALVTELVNEFRTFSADGFERCDSFAMLPISSAFVIVVTLLFMGF